MKELFKVSFFTDFSRQANKALEVAIFNGWSFSVQIDIIHLVEEGTYAEAKEKLDNLKKDLSAGRDNINTLVFDKGRKLELITHLNESRYFLNVVGLNTTKRAGSFLSLLYGYCKGNLVVIPERHEVRIENDFFIAIEYQNLLCLESLRKVRSYLYFNYCKLSFLIKTESNLSLELREQVIAGIRDIFPNLEIEVFFAEQHRISESLKPLLEEKNVDCCVVFKGDYFDQLIINHFKERNESCTPKEIFFRVSVGKRISAAIKAGMDGIDELKLRDF